MKEDRTLHTSSFRYWKRFVSHLQRQINLRLKPLSYVMPSEASKVQDILCYCTTNVVCECYVVILCKIPHNYCF